MLCDDERKQLIGEAASLAEGVRGRMPRLLAMRHELRIGGVEARVVPEYNQDVQEQRMDAEIVEFEGYGPRFELTPYPGKPDWSVVKMVHRDRLSGTTAAPGVPAELAATLRERCSSPNDVVSLTTKLGIAALEQAA